MNKQHTVIALLTGILTLSGCSKSDSNDGSDNSIQLTPKQTLGSQLYSDKNLSLNRTQSCATCHSLEHGFIDNRLVAAGTHVSPVSKGDDEVSFGDRNAPTAGYAQFSPEFEKDGSHTRTGLAAIDKNQTSYTGAIGGQFHDGRESNLKGQAGGPPTNAIEMGMPDKASVVDRLQANASYVEQFETLYGTDIFDDVETAYSAMAESIAEFEKSEVFASLDSRFDRYQSGEISAIPELSKAGHGQTLFFSSDFNCNMCHQLKPFNNLTGETFTNFEYHNIGVPTNAEVAQLRSQSTKTPSTPADEGLKKFTDRDEDAGKFKVPTLRNISVTAPYMHNGIFKELATVIEFYDHRSDASRRPQNPETNQPWGPAEISDNMSTPELGASRAITNNEVEALVCFMHSLTDKKFESLIPQAEIDNCF